MLHAFNALTKWAVSRAAAVSDAQSNRRPVGRLEPLEPRLLLSADVPVILGDYNGSGQVEQGDLDLVLSNWGRNFVDEGVAVPSAWVVDLPVDQVEQTDLDAVLQFWGRTVAGNAPDGRVIPIVSGQTVNSGLDLTTDIDTYSLNAEAGETLFLSFGDSVSTSFFNPGVFIFNPDGTVLALDNGSSNGGAISDLAVTQTGTHKIVVRDRSFDVAGDYGLTVVVVDETVDADNVALTSGQTVAGTLGDGDIDTFTISGTVGDKLFVQLGESVSTSFFNPGVYIYNPDGTLLAFDSASSTGHSFSDLAMEQDGTYTVVVRDSGGDVNGPYSLTAVVVDQTIDADNVALTSGQTVAGTLGEGDIDTFTISGTVGDKLFVQFGESVGTSFFNPGVYIYNPDGSLLDFDNTTSNGQSFSDLAMEQAGTYTIVARDLGGDVNGPYSLTAVVVDGTIDADNVALTSGQTVAGDLAEGDIDTFTVGGTVGDRLFVTFGESVVTSFFNPGVFIYNPDGTLLDFDNTTSAGQSFTDLAMDQNGTYTIVIRDLGGDLTGAYSLTAVVIDQAIDADNVALTSGVTVNGELAEGDIDTFTISASAGQNLSVVFAESVVTSFFNPGVFVFRPDGTLLASDNTSTNGVTFNDLAADQSGTYTILVRDFGTNSAGAYTMTATVATPSAAPAFPTADALSADLPVILGDYNGSGQVEQGDLDLVLSNWGRDFVDEGVAVPSAWVVDLPVDQVEQTDLDAVLQFWGRTVAGNAPDGRVIPIVSGQTVSSGLDTAADVDTFSLDAEAGETLFVNVGESSASSLVNPGVFVFNPDGTVLVSQDGSSSGVALSSIAVTQSGTHRIVIRDSGQNASFDYAFTAVVVDETIDADNVALTSGTTVLSDLGVGDIDTFTINGAAGETLFVTANESSASSLVDPGVFVFNPDGTLLASQDNSTAGLSLSNVALTQTGTYTVVLRDFGGGSTYNYGLTAVVVNQTVNPDDTVLTSGTTVESDLGLGDIDTFKIAGTAGETLFLNAGEASASSLVDPGVFVFNPDGTLLASQDNSTAGLSLSNVALTQTGTYTVVLRDFDGGNTYNYGLTAVVVNQIVNPDDTVLTSGTTVESDLGLGDIDTFKIAAAAGATLFVTANEASASSLVDPGVFVFNPDGTLLASQDDSTFGLELSNLVLTQTGTYTVVLRDFGGGNVFGYGLTAVVVDDVIDADNVTLTSGQVENGTLALGDIDTFTIGGAVGQTLTLSVTEASGSSAVDPGAFVFNPDGTLLAFQDDASAGILLTDLALAQTGTYTIVLRDFGGNAVFNYTLTATLAAVPPSVVESLEEPDAPAQRSHTPAFRSVARAAFASGPRR